MRPKGKLLALVAMFAAVGLITATGAFTTVEAQRTATVDVSGDSSALLQLQPSDGDTSSGIVQQGDDGQLTVDLTDPGDEGATGLNPNARTEFSPAIDVTNQGTNEVELGVSISIQSDDIDAESVMIEISEDSDTGDAGTDLTSNDVTLGSGDSASLNLIFDLTDENGDQIDQLSDSTEITITFEANDTS